MMKRQHELLSCKYALKRMATGHPRILDPHSRKRNQGTKIYFYNLGICLNLTNKSYVIFKYLSCFCESDR